MPPRKTRASKAAAAATKAPPPPISTESSTEVFPDPALENETPVEPSSTSTEDDEETLPPRSAKSMAPSPSPALETRARRSRGTSGGSKNGRKDSEPAIEEEEVVVSEGREEEPVIAEEEEADPEDEGAEEVSESVERMSVVDKGKGKDKAVEVVEDEEEEEAPVQAKLSMEERMAKLKDLRMKMSASTAANRKDLIADHQKSKVTAKELQRLEKQKKLAQTLRLKAEAEEAGEDLERKKNWEWSIEQNDRWEAKQEATKIIGNNDFHNAEDEAHKQYNRHLKSTKPDLVHYERAKEAALGLAPGTLVPAGATSSSLASSSRSQGLTAAEDFYRGADTLSYGDSKPSEEAVDRVTGKINKDMGKGKRKKKDDKDEEVNYINDRNKVFNKKIARYFDKYTKEIRANFERGTAL